MVQLGIHRIVRSQTSEDEAEVGLEADQMDEAEEGQVVLEGMEVDLPKEGDKFYVSHIKKVTAEDTSGAKYW